jgi:hypothetical protein
VTGSGAELLSGLPDRVQRLVATPPATEKKLLELSATWAGLPPSQARMVEALRLFLITWDPLELRAPRPTAFATVNGGPADLELVAYIPVWTAVELATAAGDTVAAVLGALGGSAVVTAAEHEPAVFAGRYPDQVVRGEAPDLLADRTAGAALGTASIRLKSPGWEDIGLGAITDIVQHAYGTVDLDRSPVELSSGSRPGCPACDGRRFGFPADLAEARDEMCPTHRSEAEQVINTRLTRAEASNPDGWGALGDATVRLELPHLPNGLATKLADAPTAMYEIPEPDELTARARHVAEAARWFAGRRDELTIALGEEPALAGQLPDWLVSLVLDCGRAGLGAEAVMVGDALVQIDPGLQPFVDGDVAVALAQAGLADEARARIEANLRRSPGELWVRAHAGDALVALGDLEGATAHFEAALDIADEIDDFEARSDVVERLRQIGAMAKDGRTARLKRQRQRHHSRSRRKRRR